MRPRRFTDEEILEVARETFLELGPHTSTTVIAERVGVSQATLFKRFGSKDALLIRALQPSEGWTVLQRLVAGPDDERPMRDQLTELLSEMAAFFDKMAPCLAVLRSSGAFPPKFEGATSPPILARLELQRWLEIAQARGELSEGAAPEHLAVALIAITQARAMRRHLLEDRDLPGDDAAYLLAMLDMLFLGVAP